MNRVSSFSTSFLVLCGALVGCQPTSSPSTSSQAVSVRWPRDPESLDPFAQLNSSSAEGIGLLYQSLLGVDVDKCVHVPLLSQTLPSVSARGDSLSVITFRLRPEARWDDGQAILASDVAFSLRLLFCPQVPAEDDRLAVEPILKNVELDPRDPRRVVLICRGHSPSLGIALGDMPVLPEHYLDPQQSLRQVPFSQLSHPGPGASVVMTRIGSRYQAAELARHPEHLPGSGPYQLTKWESGRTVTFAKKPHWWGDSVSGHPLVFAAVPQQLRYQVLPEDASATLALRRGEVDVYPQVPARTFARLQNSLAAQRQLRFYTKPSLDVITAGFNTSRPALADTATRHALSQLFDYDQLLRATQLGLGQRAVGIFAPDNRQDYNDSIPLIVYSPHLAAIRLQHAGWHQGATGWVRGPHNEPLTIHLRFRAADPTYEVIALQFSQAARSIGIHVELQPTEASVLAKSLRDGDFDMYVQLLKGNPFRFDLSPILTESGIGTSNFSRFSTPASTRLIQALANAEAPAEHTRLIRRVQVMMRQQLPLVPLFFVPIRVVANRELTNLHVTRVRPGYQVSAIGRGQEPATVATN